MTDEQKENSLWKEAFWTLLLIPELWLIPMFALGALVALALGAKPEHFESLGHLIWIILAVWGAVVAIVCVRGIWRWLWTPVLNERPTIFRAKKPESGVSQGPQSTQ